MVGHGPKALPHGYATGLSNFSLFMLSLLKKISIFVNGFKFLNKSLYNTCDCFELVFQGY